VEIENTMSKKLVTITRRTALVLSAIAIVSVVVTAAFVSNYIVHQTANITTSPGLGVFSCDPATNPSITLGPAITSYDWGDLQLGQSKTTLFVSIANIQGSANQFILSQAGNPAPASDDTSTTANSLRTRNLEAGLSVSWNFEGLYAPATSTMLSPGSHTQCLSITLSVSTSTVGGPTAFDIAFTSYSTATG